MSEELCDRYEAMAALARELAEALRERGCGYGGMGCGVETPLNKPCLSCSTIAKARAAGLLPEEKP